MLAIELQAVTKRYPGTTAPAVQSVSLAVKEGEIVTLLGPSGSGKTTLLRLIAGFERAGTGVVHLAGEPVSGQGVWVPPEKRGVGMVFQDYALFPHLTVARNVGFGYRGPDKQARISEVLRLVDLDEYQARYPHELSGGQQQRVALARALARRPVVVLLDEPFSNLDAALRVHMRLELRRILKAAGATAIFVSHDQADALAISDRIVVMKDGAIQQDGTPREIYQSPGNQFVATFVGHSYLLEGIVGDNGKTVVTELGTFACSHPHACKPGDDVYACIRPEDLEVVTEGAFQGTITEVTYTGRSLDAIIEVQTERARHAFPVRLDPGADVQTGETVSLHIAAGSVALVRHT
jgi:iron(III) transport system ATP-binding protein